MHHAQIYWRIAGALVDSSAFSRSKKKSYLKLLHHTLAAQFISSQHLLNSSKKGRDGDDKREVTGPIPFQNF